MSSTKKVALALAISGIASASVIVYAVKTRPAKAKMAIGDEAPCPPPGICPPISDTNCS